MTSSGFGKDVLRMVASVILSMSWFAHEGRAQAPTITEQPLSLSVGQGDRAGFAVRASGLTPLAYQWYRDGVLLPMATGEILILPDAQIAQAGSYTARVSNAQGAAISAEAKLAVSPYVVDLRDPTFKELNLMGPPLLILPDGRSIAANSDFFHSLVRLEADGKLDPTFAFETPSEGIGASRYWTNLSMARQEDGRLLLIGQSTFMSHVGHSSSYLLMRLNAEGSRDQSFVPTMETRDSVSPGVLISTGDKIIVAIGESLVRLNRDGSIDTSFATAAAQSPGGASPSITSAVLDGSGNILVGGGRSVWRLRSDGSRESSFPMLPAGETILEIAVDASGRYWVSTTERHPDEDYLSIFRLRRLGATGEVDEGFADFTCEFPTSRPPAFSFQSDGRVIVAGVFELRLPTGEAGREAIHAGAVRLTSDGVIDASFAPANSASWSKWRMLPGGTHALTSNASGVVRMKLDTLGVIEPPRILRVELDRTNVLAGDDVPVRVIAVGPGPMRITGGASITSLTGDLLTYRNVHNPLQVVVHGPGGVAVDQLPVEITQSAPRVVSQPESIVARIGQYAVFTTVVRGSPPLSYQVFKDGQPIILSGDISSLGQIEVGYYVGSKAVAGSYLISVSNSLGTVETKAELMVGSSSELANLSVRAKAGIGEEVMIVGVVSKNRKEVLFQAVGPELAALGVSGVLADPTVTLNSSDGLQISNDNGGAAFPWNDPLYGRTGATLLDAMSTKSAELRQTLPGGINTVIVSGTGGTTGVVLAQIFDGDENTNRLVNLSARVFAGTDSATAITGFIIRGDEPKKVLIRCVGPGLLAAGVEKPLMDPRLTLVQQSTHATLGTNDDWERGNDAAEMRRIMSAVGAFPLVQGSKDSAMIVSLPPGAYTALVAGAGETTGIVLLEVYDVP